MSFNEEDVVEIIKNKWEEFKNENMDPDNAVNKILDKLGNWIVYSNKRQRLVIKTLLIEVEQTVYSNKKYEESRELLIKKLKFLALP